MTRTLAALGIFLDVFVLGCGASGAETGVAGSSGGSTSTSSTGTSPTSTAVSSTSDGSAGFANILDLPMPGVVCDPWQDTCPMEQKCKPYSVGLGDFSEASCVPIAEPPTPAGEGCGAAIWSMTDECERGAVCHGFMLPEGSWRCHELCSGSPQDPTCADACSRCTVLGNGIAGVCLLSCDPRVPNCAEGQVCVTLAEEGRFLCAPVPGSSAAGETCFAVSDCTEGTGCVGAALVPGCMGDKCCTPVCDLDGADTCAKALPGTLCAPLPVSGPDFQVACIPAGLGLCMA